MSVINQMLRDLEKHNQNWPTGKRILKGTQSTAGQSGLKRYQILAIALAVVVLLSVAFKLLWPVNHRTTHATTQSKHVKAQQQVPAAPHVHTPVRSNELPRLAVPTKASLQSVTAPPKKRQQARVKKQTFKLKTKQAVRPAPFRIVNKESTAIAHSVARLRHFRVMQSGRRTTLALNFSGSIDEHVSHWLSDGDLHIYLPNTRLLKSFQSTLNRNSALSQMMARADRLDNVEVIIRLKPKVTLQTVTQVDDRQSQLLFAFKTPAPARRRTVRQLVLHEAVEQAHKTVKKAQTSIRRVIQAPKPQTRTIQNERITSVQKLSVRPQRTVLPTPQPQAPKRVQVNANTSSALQVPVPQANAFPVPAQALATQSNVRISKTPLPLSKKQQSLAQYQRALDLIKQGQRQAGMDSLRQVLYVSPGLKSVRQTLAALYIEQGQFMQAESILSQGLLDDPKYYPFAELQARIYSAQGANQRAFDTLMRVAPAVKKAPAYYAFMAALQQRLSKPKRAIELYNQALRIQPKNALWWMGLGIASESAGYKREALQAYYTARQYGLDKPSLQEFVNKRLQQLKG